MLRNHKSNFHRFVTSGLLAAPLVLAGIAVTGGHVHADQMQSRSTNQTTAQNTNVSPFNIQETSNHNPNIIKNWSTNSYQSANNPKSSNAEKMATYQNDSQMNPHKLITDDSSNDNQNDDQDNDEDNITQLQDQLNQADRAENQAVQNDDKNASQQALNKQQQIINLINQSSPGAVSGMNGGSGTLRPDKMVKIPIIIYEGPQSSPTPKPFYLDVNPAIIPNYDGNNLTANELINGSADGDTGQISNSPYFGNIYDQIDSQYSTTKGVKIPGTNESGNYVIRNGKATGQPFKMYVTQNASSSAPHYYYSTTDGIGNAPIVSDDAHNGITKNQAAQQGVNIPSTINPNSTKQGFDNGNGNSDSADQQSGDGSDSAGNSSGSGGGSSSCKGGGAAAAAGAAGGATGAGGAGGGTDGTAGGVAQGGNGNNDAAMSGPVNNDVIPSGSTDASNNNGANNNVVPESPIINNNDHSNGNKNGDNAQYDADVKDDNALIAIIGNLANTDQKNHGILADLIDKDENRGLNRQLDNDEHNSNMQTQFTDENNSLAASVQQAASTQHNANQMRSLEDHFMVQSMEQSMAQSSAIASLKASAEVREFGYNKDDTDNPFEANSTVQSNSANNPLSDDISNSSSADNDFGSNNTDPFGLNNLVNSNSANSASASNSNSTENNANDIANAFNKAFSNNNGQNDDNGNAQNEGNNILNQFDNTVNGNSGASNNNTI